MCFFSKWSVYLSAGGYCLIFSIRLFVSVCKYRWTEEWIHFNEIYSFKIYGTQLKVFFFSIAEILSLVFVNRLINLVIHRDVWEYLYKTNLQNSYIKISKYVDAYFHYSLNFSVVHFILIWGSRVVSRKSLFQINYILMHQFQQAKHVSRVKMVWIDLLP